MLYFFCKIIEEMHNMNLKIDLSKNDQDLLQELGIKIENKDYTPEELKTFTNSIGEYIFNQSSKNGDIARAVDNYGELLRILIKNEK